MTALSLSGALVFTALFTGCIVEEHHAPPPPPTVTTIELGEMENLGYTCASVPGLSWTAQARETGDQGTAGCQQPIDFVGYTPGATYTFDITGYDGQRLCWQGTCSVVAQPVETTFADCSGQIAHLCGY